MPAELAQTGVKRVVRPCDVKRLCPGVVPADRVELINGAGSLGYGTGPSFG